VYWMNASRMSIPSFFDGETILLVWPLMSAGSMM
jgi:hypothetical protein